MKNCCLTVDRSKRRRFSTGCLRACVGLSLALALLVIVTPDVAYSNQRTPIRRVYNARKAKISDNAIFQTRSGAGLLSKAQYRDLARASMELLKLYPPDKHHFISVGRDAAPVMAFLYNLGREALVSFCPGSSNGAAPDANNFKKYGDKFLPSKKVLGKKKVVLVDMTSSGRGLASYQPHITTYLQQRDPSTHVSSVAYSFNQTTQANHTIGTDKYPDVKTYYTGAYENDIAMFDRHPINAQSVPPKSIRKEFYDFSKAVLRRMTRDPELDKFLQSLGAGKNPAAKPPLNAAGKPTRAYRWGVASPYIAGLPALPKGAQLNVRRTVKGEKQNYSLLSGKDYAAYSNVVQQLTKKYPPEKGTVYVGVGRSSTPIFGILEMLDPQRAAYLPIDNAGKLTAKEAAAVGNLVASFIPATTLKNAKEIVLYQKGSGAALANVQPLIQQALQAAGYKLTVKSVALHSGPTPKGVARIDIGKSAPLQALDGPEIKAVAPITRTYVGKHAEPAPQYRSKFGKLQRTLDEFMQRDQGFDKFLNE